MTVISQETFEKFSKEEKNKIRKDYANFTYLSENGIDEEERIVNYHLVMTMREYFGEENLQSKPEIKTWEDVVANNIHDVFDDYVLVRNCVGCSEKLKQKLEATLKIAKLIELGYGGMVSDEEWKDTDIEKYCVYAVEGKIDFNGYSLYEYHFIAFHTSEQRKKFMSYPENVKLVEQFYMTK